MHTSFTRVIDSAPAGYVRLALKQRGASTSIGGLVCPGNFVPAEKLGKLAQEGPEDGKTEVHGGRDRDAYPPRAIRFTGPRINTYGNRARIAATTSASPR